MTLLQLCNNTVSRLSARYPAGEARMMMRIIMEHLKGYSLTDLAIKADDEVSDFLCRKTSGVVDRLLNDEPIQYIFSEAVFYGMKLRVTPAVLIPRPETAELVDLIVSDYADRQDLRVLDVCTGSGCIAIALSRNLPFARVSALDLSDDALAIAHENARTLHARIDIFHADALKLPPEPAPLYDIIVSNPPYIAEHERESMEPNVLLHEPQMALFVPDSDPLRFYRAIAAYAMTALTPGGALYFEINPLFADRLVGELKSAGWTDVETRLDMQQRRRFLKAIRPGS